MFLLFFFSASCLATGLCAGPGESRWQQRVDFNITVRLSPDTKTLDGEVSILYTNNSPDTLRSIYFHLWPNAYSRYNTAFARQLLQSGSLRMDQMPREHLGAIGKLEFTVNDEAARFERDDNDPDIGLLYLKDPLPPGTAIEIRTPFRVKVPQIISRMGYSNDYFSISQWYPKPAVYDQDGWHPMPYLDKGEYYADFGKYMVTIDVPGHYEVAATGIRTRDVIESGRRTIIYEQDDIIDFAWFASPEFQLITSEVDIEGGHTVLVQTYHTTEDGHWQEVNAMAENALKFYSEKVGPYPYKVMTLVEGPLRSGSGMEYPTITIMRNTSSKEWLEVVVAHEVGHNWWQAILASNERLHPWIDEGINSYYEERYDDEVAINPRSTQNKLTRLKVARMFDVDHITNNDYINLRILQQERLNKHQAICVHPQQTTSRNYSHNHYAKFPAYFKHMVLYIGLETFDDCMRTFYEKYAFSHIRPEDLHQHFESCSGKELDFIFADRVETADIVDTRIRRVAVEEDKTVASIGRKGIAVPVPVTAHSDMEEQTVWAEADDEEVEFGIPGIRKIIIDEQNLTLDYKRSNNYWKSNGFRKLEKVSPFFLGSIERPDRSRFFFVPVVAGNTHDKFMLGLALYNRVWPAKNIDWSVVPMYAFGSKQANGIFNFTYYQNIRRDRHVQLAWQIHFKTFSYDNSSSGGRYINFAPSVTATILPENRTKNIHHELMVKHHQNWIDIITLDTTGKPVSNAYSSQAIGELRYTMVRKDVKTPVSVSTYAYNNRDHLKVGTELSFKIRYGKIKSFVHGRFFLEGFVYKRNEFATSRNLGYGTYRSGLGGTTGANDYRYEHHYLSRNGSGFASRQVAMDQGQFKFSNPSLLRANALVTSVNIRADFPSKWVPIQLYMDFGVAMNEPASGLFAFQAGAILSLFDEGIEVYFPFFSSSEISNFYDLNIPKYKQRITFSFDLGRLNIHKKARTYSL
jgi:hypothetical protein